jgi:L-Lysine epsilon oxidase N-terminal/L-lysine epsilon oxidase C-terminal domain
MANTTTLEIHPAIGIARVGTSREFLTGPEPGEPIPMDRRDATADKLLKRQAARFRVYSCVRDPQGKIVSFEELTPAKAIITWTVHLVNRKAAAPAFRKGGLPNTDRSFRRNSATGNPATDKPLIIDGGAQTLTGASQPTNAFQGTFKGHDVPLGEMSTNADGRLIVVGGFGTSRSFPTTPIGDFADNDNWHDDTSDGPVEANVHFLDGRQDQKVDKPAWVVCCQPDFAPGIRHIVTLYDALIDQGITRGVLALPTFRPAFDRDIFPLLQRALVYQWVNQFNQAAHGPGAVADFSDPDLGDPTTPNGDRIAIFRHLSDPDHPTAGPIAASKRPMPALFSDDYFTDKTLPLLLTRSQYRVLKAWASGAFDASASSPPAPATGDPDELTQFALDGCVGAAFCPGIEAGRRIRDDIYAGQELFRFDRGKLEPGGLTESMALPWQADFFDCTWEISPGLGQGRGWWPAQRPDDVFTSVGASTMDAWVRGISNVNDFIANWSKLGVVLDRGTPGSPFFVEDQRALP